MIKIEPEAYNEYGEIVKMPRQTHKYGRTMSTYDQHRIHETKWLFDSECSLCRKSVEHKQEMNYT